MIFGRAFVCWLTRCSSTVPEVYSVFSVIADCAAD